MKYDRKLCHYSMIGLIVIWLTYAVCMWNIDVEEICFRMFLVLILCIFYYRIYKTYKYIGDISDKFVEKTDVYTLITPFLLAMIFSMYIVLRQYVTEDAMVVFAYGTSMASFILYRFPLVIDKDRIFIAKIWYASDDIDSVHIYELSKEKYKVVFYTKYRVKEVVVSHEFIEELLLFVRQGNIALFL